MAETLDLVKYATATYFGKWDAYRKLHDLESYPPTAIGWKVADAEAFRGTLDQLLGTGKVEQLHIGTVNDRYIAAIFFNASIAGDIRVLKLMQRRQGSIDPTGLDHVDFFVDSLEPIQEKLKAVEAEWELESNDAHEWVSLRWDGWEAKFVDHTVLDVGAQELTEASQEIL